jgi:pimeloyl-ACP methyl ester carboxylesterase
MHIASFLLDIARTLNNRINLENTKQVGKLMSHMMKTVLKIFLLFLTVNLFGQNKSAEDYGFRHFQTFYKGDTVDVLIKSKNGDEQKKKPLFLFCQGSLPTPLIIYGDEGMYGVFPFNTDSLTEHYHIAIISKPFIPLISEAKSLSQNFTYTDKTGKFPEKYTERNLLSYYVNRNIEVIRFLQKQKWVSNKQLVVAGHSEGSSVAAKLALSFPGVTHLIYAGGNPMGRIMSIIEKDRAIETNTDSTNYGEDDFIYWQNIVDGKNSMDASSGSDTYKATFEYSQPLINDLEKLKIPVMVCYGTKDWCAPFNDYLRADIIRKHLVNFTFKAYIGTEHNFFTLLPDGKINYEVYNWDKVADDWCKWLKEKH